jgi:hypothetical protein
MPKKFNNLQEYISLTREVVKANKDKGNRYAEILSSLYADPVHFLDEIVQNAEDACARVDRQGEMIIHFHQDGIAIYHNGDPFNDNDFIAITTYGRSTKQHLANINKIGKFGIGFRSVFGITDAPEIHSNGYDFVIRDFELLEYTDHLDIPDPFTTLFWFPFKKNISYIDLWEKVKTWDYRFILFLNYISKIEILNDETKEKFIIEKIATDDSKIATLSINKNDTITTQNYLVINKLNNKQKRLTIALSLEKFGTVNPLFVFFPTKELIHLPFIVHGFFTTTPTREHVLWDNADINENKVLLNQLKNLFLSFLKELRNRNLLIPDLYEAFTLFHYEHPIEKLWAEQWIYFLKNDKSILSKDAKYMPTPLIAFPKDKLLAELIPKDVLNKSWDKKAWINTELVDKTNFAELIKKELSIRIIDEHDFACALKKFNFNKNYNSQQIEYFYELIAQNPELVLPNNKNKFYSLSDFPWLYTADNKWKTWDEEMSNIFLCGAPDPTININPLLLKNENIVNLFYSLNIKPYDDKKGINYQLTTLIQKKAYRKFWDLLLRNADIIDYTLLQNFECLINIKNEWHKPSDLYLASKELEYYFSYNINFVNFKWFEKNFSIALSQLLPILEKLNVNKFPKKVEIKNHLSEDEKLMLRANSDVKPIVEERIYDFNIEGLDDFLLKINFEKSNFLLHWILQFPDHYWWGKYSWASYIREEEARFHSTAWRSLFLKSWIYDVDDNVIAISDLDISRLKANYRLSATELQQFINLFELSVADDFNLSLDELKLVQMYRSGTLNLADEIKSKNNKTKVNIHYFDIKEISKKGFEVNSLKLLEEFEPSFPKSLSPLLQIKKPFEKIFYKFTDIAYQWIMQQAIANNENYKIHKCSDGYIDLLKNDIVMTRYYIGGREEASDYFMIYKTILNANVNIPTSLLLVDISDLQNPLLLEIKDYKLFIENNIINPEIIFILW